MTGRARGLGAVSLAVALALVLVAGGCSDGGTDEAPDPTPTALPGTDPAESPPDIAPTPEPPPLPLEPEMVGPEEGLEDVRPHPWDEVFVINGERGVELRWTSEPCRLLDRIEIDYSEQAVTVTLYLGQRDADAPCDDAEAYRARRRSLPEPVGNRSLVDGARL